MKLKHEKSGTDYSKLMATVTKHFINEDLSEVYVILAYQTHVSLFRNHFPLVNK